MTRALIALAFVLGIVVPAPVCYAQRDRFAGAGAGIYFGTPSTHNGPVLFARVGKQLGKAYAATGRVHFRDDDPSGGRVQALGLGVELIAMTPGPAYVYGVAGLGTELVLLSDPPSFGPPDMREGLNARVHVGAGLGFRLGTLDLLLELDRGFGGGVSTSAFMLGARSPTQQNANGGSIIYLTANRMNSPSSRYAADSDSRGYTIAIDTPSALWFGRAIRMSVGIDFMQFGRFSTGVIQLLAGIRSDIVGSPERPFSLSWVAHFAEVGHPVRTISDTRFADVGHRRPGGDSHGAAAPEAGGTRMSPRAAIVPHSGTERLAFLAVGVGLPVSDARTGNRVWVLV